LSFGHSCGLNDIINQSIFVQLSFIFAVLFLKGLSKSCLIQTKIDCIIDE